MMSDEKMKRIFDYHVKPYVIEKKGPFCQLCQYNENIDVYHLVYKPTLRNKAYFYLNPENCMVLCPDCKKGLSSKKGELLLSAFQQGFLKERKMKDLKEVLHFFEVF
jgi:hypothetical protein